MKKSVLILLSTTTLCFTQGYTKADRILDMQKMAKAMQEIQTGFFYNNLEIVQSGTKVLKETIDNIRPTDEEINTKDIYERWLNNNIKMTNKIRKKIIRKATDIEDRFKSGDSIQALQAYSKIAQQCMKCHIEIRKW